MIQKFLKAKHWQLFLLTFGIPMFFQFIFMGSMIATIQAGNNANQAGFLKLFPIMLFVFVSIFFGWFWSVVTGLQSNIPDEIKMKLTRFKIFFFIPISYIVLISLYMGMVFNGFKSGTSEVDAGMIAVLMVIIVPLHLFSMFCIFHTLYYVAKTLKTAELKRTVTFSDFAGEFFLIWFYPIGIWIIQPQINKLVENRISISEI